MAKSYGFTLTCSANRRPTESEKLFIPRNLQISKCGYIRKGIKFSFKWWIWNIEFIFSFTRKTIENKELSEFLKNLEGMSIGTGH